MLIGGLLSIIVDAYREGVIEDAWIVPVSMNYDRILEGNFVREQLGQPKKKETFFAAISTFIKALCSHYGIMRVDFNVPYRLRVCCILIMYSLCNIFLQNKQTLVIFRANQILRCWQKFNSYYVHIIVGCNNL